MTIYVTDESEKHYVTDGWIEIYLPPDGQLYLISRGEAGFMAGIKHGVKYGFISQILLPILFHDGDVTIEKQKTGDRQ